MKRPLAYITAAWFGGDSENAELAAQYCRAVYEAGFVWLKKNKKADSWFYGLGFWTIRGRAGAYPGTHG